MADSMSDNDGSAAVVPAGVLCFGCGYDLRTLRWDGACPECGRAVCDSVRRLGLHFGSRHGVQRARVAIGLWAAAAALTVVCRVVFTIVVLTVLPAIWHAPDDQPSFLRNVFWVTGRAYSFSPLAAATLIVIVAVLVTSPFARGRLRFRRCLGIPAAGLTVLGGVYTVLWSIHWIASGFALYSNRWIPIVGTFAGLAFSLGQLLVWLYLCARVDRRRRWRLWLLMHLALIVPIVVLVQSVAWSIFVRYLTPLSTGLYARSLPPWVSRFYEFMGSVQETAGPPLQMLQLAALWFFLRALNGILDTGRLDARPPGLEVARRG